MRREITRITLCTLDNFRLVTSAPSGQHMCRERTRRSRSLAVVLVGVEPSPACEAHGLAALRRTVRVDFPHAASPRRSRCARCARCAGRSDVSRGGSAAPAHGCPQSAPRCTSARSGGGSEWLSRPPSRDAFFDESIVIDECRPADPPDVVPGGTDAGVQRRVRPLRRAHGQVIRG
jgi:hypothetical protein